MKTICKAIALLLSVSAAAAVLSGCSVTNKKTAELSRTTIDSISSIHLNVGAAEVELIPAGNEFALEYHIVNQNVDYSVKNGALTLKADSGKTTTINTTERSYIKIYVPEGSEFTGIDYEGGVGDIRIGKIKVDDMTVNTGVGNVELSDITVNKNLRIETGVGDIKVDLANEDCSYDISAGVAEIVINGTEYSGLEVEQSHTSEHGPQVDIKTGTGSIHFNCK